MKKRFLTLAVLLAFVFSTFLANGILFLPVSAGASADSNATFYNDAQTRGADPHVLYDKASGYYYAYSTDGARSGYRFGIYRSADLSTWEQLNGAIPSSDPNAWANDWFWAPECYYNPNNGYYYLFYSGRMTGNADKLAHFGFTSFEEACKTGVAVSKSPEGPFYNITKGPIDYYPYDPDYHDVNLIMDTTQRKPPETQELGATAPLGVYLPFIDANVFFDDNGEIYLYYSRNAYRNWVWDTDLNKYIEESNIYAVKLTTDWWNTTGAPVMPTVDPASINANKAPTDGATVRKDGFTPVINYGMQKQAWENGHVNDYATTNGANKDRRWAEGSTTMKFKYTQNGVEKSKYYMVYSCNNYQNQWYGEGYATADNPMGPWTKAASNPIVAQNDQGSTKIFSTGHGSFIPSPDGSELFHVYHARPTTTANRFLYTNKFIFDEAALDASGVPTLRVDQVLGDQATPSGVAPYRIKVNAQTTDNISYPVSFAVTNADGGNLALSNTANRVRVEISDPTAATYTSTNATSGTVKLLSDKEVTVTFTYQKRKADGTYFDVCNDASDAASLVRHKMTLGKSMNVQTGERFTLPITLENCQSLAGARLSVQYDPELLTLEAFSAKGGFAFLSEGNTLVAVTSNGMGMSGDVVIGYAIFTAKANLTDDVASHVTFPADQLMGYGENLKATYPTAPSVKINIFGATPVRGDVNLDGTVDLADVVLLMQYLSGNINLTSRQLRAADVSSDGAVNVGDSIIIMQMCLA